MASQVIPEAAVIAASKALMADKMSNHSGDNAPQIMDACERVARTILEAAAPHIMAQALKEAADNVPDYDLPFMVNGRNVEHVSWWLAGRAEDIRAGKL